jgi:hypothetical protein
LLETFPDAKDQIVSFGLKNLAMLTIESLHDFIVNTKDVPVPVVVKEELVLSSDDIEKVAKAFKCHRCVLDFDSAFVHSELRKGKDEMNNNEME